jgi:flagellar biosynthesis/type III secretory pathway protein FliH
LSDPRPAPRRHEWMPNRMFDPATNPFAIQNLLEKEKKEDTPFLLKRDERPVFDYSDDAMLNESKIQPAVDFQFDELLDQPIMSSPAFHAEVDGQFSPDSLSETALAKVDDSSSIRAESSKKIVEKNSLDSASDDSLNAPAPLDVDTADNHAAKANVDAAENLASATTTDASDATEVADAHTQVEAQAHDASPEQDASTQESAQELVLDASDDGASDELTSEPDIAAVDAASNAHHQLIATEQSLEQNSNAVEPTDELISPDAESEAALSQPLPEPEIITATEPEVALGLNNEAVTELIEAAREEARVDAHAAGFQEGLEAGLEQAKAEMQASVDEKLAVIDQMVSGLQKLQRDPNTLFEPMKKLAIHLAEQLVRGELTQSAQVIARLVDNCLRELAASGEKAVIVHLNPEDLEQYKPLTAQFGDSLVLRPDALLARGSVRASLDGSVVEDLIDRRVKGLSKSLAQPVASSWRPALATPSAKPTVAPKPATTVAPAATVTPSATLDALDNENDEVDDSDHDDDVMFDDLSDDLSDDHIDNAQADRNDETHS